MALVVEVKAFALVALALGVMSLLRTVLFRSSLAEALVGFLALLWKSFFIVTVVGTAPAGLPFALLLS